jgi:hypothetical protein
LRRLIPVAIVVAIVAAGGAGAWYWWQQHLNALPPEVSVWVDGAAPLRAETTSGYVEALA